MAVMDDRDFETYGGASATPSQTQWLINIAGAVTSVALVIGVGVWGYQLAVRDVTGIPVVRALAGPMRIAPQDPGGEIAAHTGLSVNQIAAEGGTAPLPDQMVLAPRPVELSPEDQPVALAALAPTAPTATAPEVAVLAALPVPGSVDPGLPPLAPGDLTETVLPPAPDAAATPDALETAVEDALAEALGGDAVALAASEPAPAGAVVRSPRPERRPEGDGTADVLVPASLTEAPAFASGEVDVASLTAGTRLVQLGAFDDEAGARAEWAALQGRFGELIASKALVLQRAESGGRTFVRLRALGFEDEADARRFCSALLAENASCIPVAHRP